MYNGNTVSIKYELYTNFIYSIGLIYKTNSWVSKGLIWKYLICKLIYQNL